MPRVKILSIFLGIICLGSEVLATSPRINDLRYAVYPTKVRLVFDISGPIQYSLHQQNDKIIIELKDAKLIGLLNKTWLHLTPVKSINSKQEGKNLQLILHLKQQVKLQHFILPKPYRLVLDLQDMQPKFVASQPKVMPKSLRDIIIVIDPGHGGKDPGAIGRRGTREKTVVLAVAKALQTAINKTKGFRAVLTRNGDYFLNLRERLDIAHRHKADMFIAIHADAYKDSKSHGVSIFALSQSGATSEAARWLAEKENASELGNTLADKSVQLKSVLIDLAQTATISASLEIGSILLRKLASIAYLHSRRIEQAAFVVLKAPDMPSLLVETGFISDPKEEKRLNDAKYQRKIAAGLAQGIVAYFQNRPPQGTYLAQVKHGK